MLPITHFQIATAMQALGDVLGMSYHSSVVRALLHSLAEPSLCVLPLSGNLTAFLVFSSTCEQHCNSASTTAFNVRSEP